MPKDGVIDELNKILHNGGYTPSKYILSGFLADLDTTKQEQILRPFKFSVERKAAEASTAPMKTGDHLAFLEGLEGSHAALEWLPVGRSGLLASGDIDHVLFPLVQIARGVWGLSHSGPRR